MNNSFGNYLYIIPVDHHVLCHNVDPIVHCLLHHLLIFCQPHLQVFHVLRGVTPTAIIPDWYDWIEKYLPFTYKHTLNESTFECERLLRDQFTLYISSFSISNGLSKIWNIWKRICNFFSNLTSRIPSLIRYCEAIEYYSDFIISLHNEFLPAHQ